MGYIPTFEGIGCAGQDSTRHVGMHRRRAAVRGGARAHCLMAGSGACKQRQHGPADSRVARQQQLQNDFGGSFR